MGETGKHPLNEVLLYVDFSTGEDANYYYDDITGVETVNPVKPMEMFGRSICRYITLLDKVEESDVNLKGRIDFLNALSKEYNSPMEAVVVLNGLKCIHELFEVVAPSLEITMRPFDFTVKINKSSHTLTFQLKSRPTMEIIYHHLHTLKNIKNARNRIGIYDAIEGSTAYLEEAFNVVNGNLKSLGIYSEQMYLKEMMKMVNDNEYQRNFNLLFHEIDVVNHCHGSKVDIRQLFWRSSKNGVFKK